jgi:hypothetical protein
MPVSEHTPTPWRIDGNAVITTVDGIIDDIVCVSDHADTPNWTTDAAFIVKTANEYDELAAELEYLRTLLSNAVHEFPVASGLYVDSDGMAGYGSLKAMRLRLGLAPNRGFLHLPTPVGPQVKP